jgi:peptide/nickel transport system substrate-binding protein
MNDSLARRQFLKLTGALLAVGPGSGLLAACGPGPSAAPTTVPESKPAATTPGAAPLARRAPAGELTVATPEKLVALDPQGAHSVDRATHTCTRHIFDALVNRDPASSAIVPALATEWQTPDPSTWVFTLRKGVRFHDGTEFTSADVKASLERILDQKGPVAPLFAAVDAVETPDPSTVRINTKTPVGTLLSSLTLVRIAPAARLSDEGFFNSPVGTGPFKVVAWRPDAELRLEANPDYWDSPPGVKALTFRDIREVAARVTAIETGEIDLTWGLPPDQLPSLRQNADLRIDQTRTYAYYFVWFNSSREPFTDKRVRQALWHALDVDTIAKDLFQGVGERATAPIPSTVFGHAPQTPYTYDPDLARRLLADAGHPNGFEAGMIWNPGGGPQDRELAQALLSYWSKVGVRVRSLEMERALWLQDLLALNWDMDFQTNSVTTGDADFTLRRLYHSSAKRNGFANPELDTLLDQAAATLDQQKRQELYAQANKLIWDDAVGIFPLELLENWVYRKHVSGFVAAVDHMPSLTSARVS